MKVLLDECVPERFRRHIPGHDVHSARYAGFSGKRNGELLQLTEAAGYDVLLTVDQGIPFQQKIYGRRIALIVLRVPGNDIGTLARLANAVLQVLKEIAPGQVVELEFPAGPEA